MAGRSPARAETTEAESVLRRAAGLAPREWKCWVALGRFLDAQARHTIYDIPATAPAEADTATDAAAGRLSPAQVAFAKKMDGRRRRRF